MSGDVEIILLKQIKKGLRIGVFIFFLLEMILYPTVNNFFGCLLALYSYTLYSFFLKGKYVILYPFSFLFYTTSFLYRYLPLIATLLELKPISFLMENPLETFLYEILMFTVISLAFYMSTRLNITVTTYQKLLYKLNFYKSNYYTIWGLGFIGVLSMVVTLSNGRSEYGDVSGKFMQGLVYLKYAPFSLFFPSLLKIDKKYNKNLVWVYMFVITVLSIASNSRQQIIAPIATFLLLYFIYMVSNNLTISKVISPPKFFMIVLFLVFGFNFVSDVSLAMIGARGIRSDVSREELFYKTIDIYKDKDEMKSLEKIAEQEESTTQGSYRQGWSEYYLDNFMLNRYANLRISDQTIYYAKKGGFANSEMQEDLKNQILKLLPNPVLKFLSIDLDKEKLQYSRGDFLVKRGKYSFVVSSYVGDGLATFGYLYFPIQLVVSIILFMLLNSFVLVSQNKILYAPLALFSIFELFGMARNAAGIYEDIGYILRTYIQSVILYLVFYNSINLVIRLLIKK